MTTNQEYREMVERKFGKPLKDIMYDLCVIRDLVATEGASELGVPKNVFNDWRNQFRFGPNQRLADKAEAKRINDIKQYKAEFEKLDIKRDLMYDEQLSIEGFKELIQRLLEIEKYKRMQLEADSMNDIYSFFQINVFDQILKYLNQYIEGDLYKEVLRQLDDIS